MLGKLFSRLQGRAATVDTRLNNPEVGVGQTLSGTVLITGGSVGQQIRSIKVELVTHCLVELRGDRKTFANIVVAEGVFEAGWVDPGAEAFVDFQMRIPPEAPITIGSTHTFLRTRLDIENARDSEDHDEVIIRPNDTMADILNGMLAAGFSLSETEIEHRPHDARRFVQEFDFKPRSARDYGVEEVEISLAPFPGGVEVTLTVDRRGGLFSFGGDRVSRFRVMDAEAVRLNMAQELRRAIDALR